MTQTQENPTTEVETPTTVIEAVAHYQRCGDGAAVPWAQWALADAEAEGDIDDWSIYGEWQLDWVQVVVFAFRFKVEGPVTAGALVSDTGEAYLKACRIVGEMDVQVLGVKAVTV